MHKEVCSVDRPKAFQLRTWETRHPKTSNWQPKRFKICILSSLVANEQHATDGWWTHKLPPGDMILYNRQLDETIMDLIQLSKSCVKLEVPTIGPHMERSLRLTDPQQWPLAGKSHESWSEFNFFWQNNTLRSTTNLVLFVLKVVPGDLPDTFLHQTTVHYSSWGCGSTHPSTDASTWTQSKAGWIRLLILIGKIIVEWCVVMMDSKTENMCLWRRSVHFDIEGKMFRYTSSEGFEENEYYLNLDLPSLSY